MLKFGPNTLINAHSTVLLMVTMTLIFGGSRIFMRKENT